MNDIERRIAAVNLATAYYRDAVLPVDISTANRGDEVARVELDDLLSAAGAIDAFLSAA